MRTLNKSYCVTCRRILAVSALCDLQGSWVTHLKCGEWCDMAFFAIFMKNTTVKIENRSTFVKRMNECIVAQFLLRHGVYAIWNKLRMIAPLQIWRSTICLSQWENGGIIPLKNNPRKYVESVTQLLSHALPDFVEIWWAGVLWVSRFKLRTSGGTGGFKWQCGAHFYLSWFYAFFY